MFFTSLLDHVKSLLPVILCIFKVLLVLFVALWPVHELLLETLFFILLVYQLVSEFLITDLHLFNLFLIKWGKKDGLSGRVMQERSPSAMLWRAASSSILIVFEKALKLSLLCRGALGKSLVVLEPLGKDLLTIGRILSNLVCRVFSYSWLSWD